MSEYPIVEDSLKDFAINRDKKYLPYRRLPVSSHPYRCSTYQFDSFKYANHFMFISQGGVNFIF